MAERPPTPTLTTARLVLRPLQAADAPRIQSLFPHPDVVRYLSAAVPWPYPDDGAAEFVRRTLAKVAAGEEYVWTILRKGHEDEGLAGLVSLGPESETDHRGLWLGRPYWGQGLMREAAAVVADFAFDVLGMDALLLSNAAPNLASHRLKEAAGAEILGIEPTAYVDGTFPGVRWRLTAEAWRGRGA